MPASDQAPDAVPKGSVMNFNLTPSELLSRVEKTIDMYRAAMNGVAVVENPTFANVIAPLGVAKDQSWIDYGVAPFLAAVAVDKDLRDAARKADQLIYDFSAEFGMRGELNKAVHAVFTNKEEMAKLDDEDRLLVQDHEMSCRGSGMLLPPEKRKRLEAVKKRINALEIAYTECMDEEIAEALFTREELEGVPDDFFDGRATRVVDGVTKYVVTTKVPDYGPVMRYATKESTRKALFVVENTRCPDNVPRLKELVQLRHEKAQLLGYASYADLVLESMMAKTPQAVLDMLNGLCTKLAPHGEEEMANLQAAKREDAEAAGEPYTGLFVWDEQYYGRIIRERRREFTAEELKQYLPLKAVTRGVLDLYQEMLGLRIVQVDNPPVWHEDVDMFEVWEADAEVFVGHLYLDLHPREGKYNHVAAWPVRPGCERPDGTREYPVSVLLANFARPTASAPALMTHGDVVVMMHELGHVFHQLCSYTKWSLFHGTDETWDFVEAPSQMMENWAWEPEAMRRFAVHYKTGEPIPEDMLERFLGGGNRTSALFTLTHAAMGLYDLGIHGATLDGVDVDIEHGAEELTTRIAMHNYGDTKTFRCAKIRHQSAGYSARYYSYLWSKVFSADMFATRFKAEGISNPKVGRDYRREILRPGSSRDAMVSLERFLGRKPTNAAFLEKIGLEAE
ncbi:metalloendopeptidase [Coemansia javaensis]|uniref:Metalloendopeptidase n=1 Tax=Coemansia javaensis TaxID=2761396 RepID=A0A9W8HDX2_9FUNG|nr:metalloendopeptidase [Coemansia javaensis]